MPKTTVPSFIKWKRQWGGNDRVVWVVIRRIDEYWRKDPMPDDYIPPGECFYHPFGDWLLESAHKERAHMPHIGLYYGYISFTDGRHRFAWCRDRGVTAMPVSVPGRAQFRKITSLFGSASRTCRVPHRHTLV
jgi:hypothetical protein